MKKDKLLVVIIIILSICFGIHIYNNMEKSLPKQELEEVDKTVYYNYEDENEGWRITRENNTFIIDGKEIENVMRRVNFSDYESLAYFHNTLKKMGIEAELKRRGIKEGDIVKIFDLEFQYEE